MELNILYQSSDSYAPLGGISIESLLQNNRDAEAIHIYYLEDNVSAQNRQKLEDTVKKYGRTLSFYSLKPIEEMLRQRGVPPFHGSYATYCKLFAPSLLGLTTGRLLYLDCDTIIAGPLSPLWALEMGGKPLACRIELAHNSYKKLIGADEALPYFNGGVVFFDLAVWKDHRCEERLLKAIEASRTNYVTAEQDILNLTLGAEISVLPIAYNLPTTLLIFSPEEIDYIYGIRPDVFYSQEELARAAKAPVIHHMGLYFGLRPWNGALHHPQQPAYEKYKADSAFPDFAMQKAEASAVFRAQQLCYRLLPRPLYVRLHRLALARYLKAADENLQKGK